MLKKKPEMIFLLLMHQIVAVKNTRNAEAPNCLSLETITGRANNKHKLALLSQAMQFLGFNALKLHSFTRNVFKLWRQSFVTSLNY